MSQLTKRRRLGRRARLSSDF